MEARNAPQKDNFPIFHMYSSTSQQWTSQVVLVVKNLSANAEDMRHRFDPGMGRFFGEGLGNPPQYSCLENPMDRGACWAIVHSVAKSWTQLMELIMHLTSWQGLGDNLSWERHGFI